MGATAATFGTKRPFSLGRDQSQVAARPADLTNRSIRHLLGDCLLVDVGGRVPYMFGIGSVRGLAVAAMMSCAAGSSFAQEGDLLTVLPQPTQTINMTVGTSSTVAVKRPFKTIHIIDPTVVDARAETDQRFTLLPKSAGRTTINILDENSNQIASVGIVVASNLQVSEELARETYENVPGRVRVHANGKSLAGVTFYRCNPDNCEFVEELVPRIPAQEQNQSVANAPPAKTQLKSSAQ